ncbi:MAG: helix-turn-helix domain-containing protein [Treponema sp.]|nr:helix-turn-helix domain-containing protein [Treponema sp.]
MTFQELFIINLKDFRKTQGISQAKLAELCESSQAYIAEIEVGKKFPSPEMIERIAFALNLESYRLFQNKSVANEQVLTPLQRQEIASKVFESVTKIVNLY